MCVWRVEEQLLAKGEDNQGEAGLLLLLLPLLPLPLLLLQDIMERASQAISERSGATFSGAVRSAKLALIPPPTPPPRHTPPPSLSLEMCELRWKGAGGGVGRGGGGLWSVRAELISTRGGTFTFDGGQR